MKSASLMPWGARRQAETRSRHLAFLQIALALIAAWMCLMLSAPAAFADDASTSASQAPANRYNVVTVTDASGSMNETDPNGLRNQALARFVALLAQRGNKIGAVAFGEGVPLKEDLADLDTVEARRAFLEKNAQVKLENWTNIGSGLTTAVDMLDTQRDKSLPSIILLLTDGNTDMADADKKQGSLQQKAAAIERARQAGYKIYTVSLNANGKADSAELQQIAQATGGEFREVKKPEDLQSVYDLFYSMAFNAQADEGKDIVIPDSGQAEGSFDVANVGVEEANVLITGKPTDYSLTEPSGSVLGRDQLAATTLATDELTAIKVEKPAGGTWKYIVKGTPGDHVRIDVVRNNDLKLSYATLNPKGGNVEAGANVELGVKLTESGKEISEEASKEFTGNIVITDASGKERAVELALTGQGLYAQSFKLEDHGTFTVQAKLSGEGYEIASDPVTFNVGNSAPKKAQDIEQTVKLWPFVQNTATIDLKPGATDKEGEGLAYTVESSSFMKDEYKIDGSNLVMTGFSLSEGSFKIRATDKDGASATFNVVVKTVNIGLLTLIGIGVAVVAGLVVAGALLYIALNKCFYGACYVRPFDDENNQYEEEEKREKGRGRWKLAAFGVELAGIDPNAYLQASGKDFVTLVSKAPVWSGGREQRKVEIKGNGNVVKVYAGKDVRKGIEIRFESRMARKSTF